MVQVPVSVLTAQWIILFVLTALVFLFYRQLAYLMDVKGRAHDHSKEAIGGLSPGVPVPSFDFEPIGSGEGPSRWRSGSGRWQALLIADPLCGSCEDAVKAFNAVASGRELTEIDPLIITSASERLVHAIDGFRGSAIPIVRVDEGVLLHAFELKATPYLVVVDADGVVRAAGAPHDQRGIRGMIAGALRDPKMPQIPLAEQHRHVEEDQVAISG